MRYLSAFLFFFYSVSGVAQTHSAFEYQTGDLVFQDIDCGELCDAIERVTPAVNGKHFSHVGIVYVVQDSVWVVEAIGNKVRLTRIADFLKKQTDEKGNPKVVVERLKKAYQPLAARAVGFALKQIGVPYDNEYIYNNGSYYCSELVYDAFKAANENSPFFHLYPMTFKDPNTHKTLPEWKAYYKELGKKIPEGRLGISPSSIALSDVLDVVKSYY
jgi:hypothetical protein